MTALIVDSDPHCRERLAAVVRDLGYGVLECATAAQALQLGDGRGVRVVVLSARLPDADGCAVCLRLRALPALRRSPIVLILDCETRAAAIVREAGASDYVTRAAGPECVRARLELAFAAAAYGRGGSDGLRREQAWFAAIRRFSECVAKGLDPGAVAVEATRCLSGRVPLDRLVLAVEHDAVIDLDVVDLERGALRYDLRLPKAEACPLRFRSDGRGFRICDGVGDRDHRLAAGMASCLCLRLPARRGRQGVLSLSSREPSAFSIADVPNLQVLAALLVRSAAAPDSLPTILREVHHHIRNNLQGVIGLLGRYRGGYPLLAPVFDRAMSQLRAVAEVHNVLSRDTGEGVRLRDIAEGVCRVIQRSCAHRIELARAPGTGELAVPATDAVSIALIVNELIQNVISHGYPEGGAGTIRVLLETQGHGAAPPCAEASRGMGLPDIVIKVTDDGIPPPLRVQGEAACATGLDLVQALLPGAGARLPLYRDGAWTVAEVRYPGDGLLARAGTAFDNPGA